MLRDVGRWLGQERERQGVTFKAWAKRSGVSVQCAREVTQGARDCQLGTVLALAAGLEAAIVLSVRRGRPDLNTEPGATSLPA
jgi:hypothetical protein